MNIVLLTNTYSPHVGGVARSVQAFREEYLKRGHRVLVVAPEFPNTPVDEVDVVRVPAIRNFNASDFSVALPFPAGLPERLDSFQPDIIHSQHPFLLGMTAVRIARHRKLPLVFTHHTLYEDYTHYVPVESSALKKFVIELGTRYANLVDQVFAPSDSIRDLLIQRGVTTPIRVVPTGVRMEKFAHGDGPGFRARNGIPGDAFVVGHLGRLAPEKNLGFLANCVAEFMKVDDRSVFVVVGSGPSEQSIRDIFSKPGIDQRLVACGVLENQPLADALAAMDVFVFASKTETQGMVLTEAMAAGTPVIALDAPGAREVVRDGRNGRLLADESIRAFSDALQWMESRTAAQARDLAQAARETAEAFSMPRSADTALACYRSLYPGPSTDDARMEENGWEQVMEHIRTEWDILRGMTRPRQTNGRNRGGLDDHL